ncbi:MAG: glycosyltransferase family 2 protein [candidate division Zixibacteria bacterium]|nr:glycosyltransferase family 2 protein [candidate division Zixibacteria bacterium]
MLRRTDRSKKVTAVLPAYNAEKTLGRTVADIPREWVDEIILVDDASRDGTVDLALKLGLTVVRHEKNRGYGGNQKTCYTEALKREADVVVMVHPDYQYDPTYIPGLIAPILEGKSDAVFGSRMFARRGALEGGMPYWKFFANIFLTTIANGVLGYQLSEYHSGFRAYSRQLLLSLPLELNSDNFVFDSEIIVQCVAGGYRIGEVPIPTRYFKEASSIGFWKSVQYGLNILWVLMQYRLHRLKLLNFPKYEKVAMAASLKPETGN